MALYLQRRAPGTYIESFNLPKAPVRKNDFDLVIGVQGLSRKGPLDKPINITSNTYKQLLGYYLTDVFTLDNGDYGSAIYDLDQYFENAPTGADIWFKRIYNLNNAPEEASINTTGVDITIKAKNGGSWGNWLKIVIKRNDRVKPTDGYTCKDTPSGSKFVNLDDNTNALVFKAGDRIGITTSSTTRYYNVREIDADNNRLFLYDALANAVNDNDPIFTADFDIDIYDTNPDIPIHLREEEHWIQLNLNKYGSRFITTVINDDNYPAISGSNLIKITNIEDITNSMAAPNEITEASNTLLTGGNDGGALVDDDWKNLDAWNGYQVNVLANIGHYDPIVSGQEGGTDTAGNKDFCCKPSIIKAALDYMSNEDRYWFGAFVFCPPSTESFSSKEDNTNTARKVKSWRLNLGINNKLAKLYDTYYDIPETVFPTGPNPTRKMAPTSAVLGIYKRFSQVGLDRVPAGISTNANEIDAEVINAIDVYLPTNEEEYQSIVFPYDVNSFRIINNKIVVFGDKSLVRDEKWKQVNFSLYMAVLNVNMKKLFEWVPFKPANNETYNAIKEMAESYLQKLSVSFKKSKNNPKGYFVRVLNLDPEYADKIEKKYAVMEYGVSLYDDLNFFIIRNTFIFGEQSI